MVFFVEGVWFLSLVPTRNVTHNLSEPWKRNRMRKKNENGKEKGGECNFLWADST